MTVLNLSCPMLCNFFSLNSSISIICFVTVSIRFMIVVPVLKSIKGWSVEVIVNMNCQGQNYSTILATNHRTRQIIGFHAVAHQLIDSATDQWSRVEAKASGPDLGNMFVVHSSYRCHKFRTALPGSLTWMAGQTLDPTCCSKEPASIRSYLTPRFSQLQKFWKTKIRGFGQINNQKSQNYKREDNRSHLKWLRSLLALTPALMAGFSLLV